LLAGLLCGAQVRIVPDAIAQDPQALLGHVAEHGVTVLQSVPSLIQAMLDGPVVEVPSLRWLLPTGEASAVSLMRRWRARYPRVGLVNAYGPAECADDVSVHVIGLEDAIDEADEGSFLPIGRPVPNTRLLVLGDRLQLLPAGVAGELCVGGVGVGRGYLGRPGLTAERFVADPYGEPGERLYRTGDVARWRADGVLEYLGRADQQVKVRGFRIELGEIEAQLLRHGAVKAAAVSVQGEASEAKRLVGYVVVQDGVDQDVLRSELHTHLKASLPEYMVPALWVMLEQLPTTANGKLDRKALPRAEAGQGRQGRYEAPQGPVEEALAAIWSQVLAVPPVGRNDNFFELGGDSILSLQIVSRLRRAGWKIAPKHVFERQSIAELAAVAEALPAAAHAAVPDGPLEGPVPLLPIQDDFFRRAIAQPHHWNQSVLLVASGTLDAGRLAAALDRLLLHHDALRLRFRRDADGRWTQHYTPWRADADLLWQRAAQDAAAVTALCDAAQRSLDLEKGPLLRAVRIDAADGSSRLFLTAHHLAVDGVSWRILLEDLQTLYRDPAAELPAKTAAYGAWSDRLRTHAPERAAESAYWQALYTRAGQDAGACPCDDPSGSNAARHQSVATMTLDATTTAALLKAAPAAYRSQINDLLLTALGRALCRWSGRERVLVALEGHGREDMFDGIDLSRTVGWFTTLYPVLLDPLGESGTALKRVKEDLRATPDKGLGFGLLQTHGQDAVRAAMQALPRPRIVFNYLGQFDGSFGADAQWRPAPESTGAGLDADTPLHFDLALDGRVYEGRLTLDATYSRSRHRAETVQAVLADVERELRALVAHCTSGVRGHTPSDFPLAHLDQAALDALPVPAGRLEDLYPLSPMQQGMLFHALHDGASQAYLNQVRVDIDAVDVARLVAAWQAAVDAHAVLRTGFLGVDPSPLQWVADRVDLPVEELDWRGRGDLAAALDARAAAELERGFDLAQPPLVRLLLVRTAADRHHLIWTTHHLILDGWSSALLLGEVLRRYAGETPAAPPGRFRDCIARLQARPAALDEAYWRGQLFALQGPTQLASTLPVAPGQSGFGEHLVTLDAAATNALANGARNARVTLNTLLQAAWALLLHRHTGQRTVSFGATVAGRPADLPGAEQMLGLFINTLPMIATVPPQALVGEWLRGLQAQGAALREHEHTPLASVQRWAGQGGHSLFDTLLVFENYPVDAVLRQPGLGSTRLSNVRTSSQTHYPLTLGAVLAPNDQGQACLRVRWSYDRAAFAGAAVVRIAQQFAHLLAQLAGDAGQHVDCLALLTPAEAAALHHWRSDPQEALDPRAVHRLIADQAAQRPTAPALLCAGEQLDYATLERRANRLAHALIAAGAAPEVRIGIALERSADMIVALLAVLKSGAAYVPLDPAYPSARLSTMIEDSGVALVLTQSTVRSQLPLPAGLAVLEMDSWQASPAARLQPEHDPDVRLSPHHLAYVIYTSGSTGQPKGVAVAHGPLSMHVQAIGRFYGMTPADRELQFASINFDGAHERWLVPLCFGALLMPRDRDPWDAERTVVEIRAHGITIACFTPSYLHKLAEAVGEAGRALPIRSYTVGGEAMSRASFEMVQRVLRPPRIINGYGPTETVITPLAAKATSDTRLQAAYLPIGRPIGARTAYVLDADLHPVPVGVAGELYLGGEGVARGYLGRPGLTAERFVADPFDPAGGRLYRTGDLVRWAGNGEVEYLGRIDHQIKIRGFRVELGEIEVQLGRLPGVSEAAVVAHEDGSGDRRLAAYVVPQAGQLLDPAVLRAALADKLPPYMVPAAILTLQALPLNASGKVDRLALPAPAFVSGRVYVAPQGDCEAALAALWAEALQGVLTGPVGRHDHFFELGGDSLLALRVVSLARRRPSAAGGLTLRAMMQGGSLAELASRLQTGTATPPSALVALTAAVPERTTLFCLHPSVGTVFDYRPLAQRLRKARGVVGVACRMLLDPTWQDRSLEQMAEDYAGLIVAQQPEGPYALLGWSLGGTLAVQVAAVLEQQGRHVAFLGLLDPYVPTGHSAAHAASPLQEEAAFADFLVGLGEAGQAMTTVERHQAFLASRQLAALSHVCTGLPRLAVQPDCWWAAETPAAVRRSLAGQTGVPARSTAATRHDHNAIVRTPGVLDAIARTLAERLNDAGPGSSLPIAPHSRKA
jgi:amino acid adenylation domain-containing protein/non-ribosomal peptide synthase protein (TIGR01720 family)